MFSVNIIGPAAVEICNGPTFSIDTTEDLQINGTVDGQPEPNVTLSKLENGQEVGIPVGHPRITVDFIDTRLKVNIESVRVKDNGTYRIRATNEVGGTHSDFNIVTRGKNTTS